MFISIYTFQNMEMWSLPLSLVQKFRVKLKNKMALDK